MSTCRFGVRRPPVAIRGGGGARGGSSLVRDHVLGLADHATLLLGKCGSQVELSNGLALSLCGKGRAWWCQARAEAAVWGQSSARAGHLGYPLRCA